METTKKITVDYLGHSGFLVETQTALLLFDYYKGPLKLAAERADQTGKPMYVFASHVHGDHFNPEIFSLEAEGRKITYVLAFDIRGNKKIPGKVAGEIHYLDADQTVEIAGLGTVETLKSTDEGVAFFITDTSGNVIYHAGDLHWWDWEGEDQEWLDGVEALYKQEIGRIAGRKIDLAFVVLDDRLEQNYAEGMTYFLQQCEAEMVFPMHFWEDRTVIRQYLALPEIQKMTADKKMNIINTAEESHWEIG